MASETLRRFGHQPCYRSEHVCLGCGVAFRGLKRRKFCSHRCALASGLAKGSQRPGREPTKHPSELDVAWTAGVYEGEGCAIFAGGSTIVSVSQKARWLLDKLREMYGGVVYEQNKGTGQFICVWQISGDRAMQFLSLIYRQLSPRRQKQALRAMR